jgi:outer membrane protein
MKSFAFFLALLAATILVACQPEPKPEAKPASTPEVKTEATPATRLAVISSRDVLTRCDQGAKVISEIQGKFSERRSQMALMEQDIRRLQDEVKDSGGKNKTSRLQEKLQKFAEEDQKFRQEVNQEENLRFAPIVESVNKILVAYAKEKGISAIQERGAFIFFENNLDITEDIIKRVNQAKTSQP